MKTYCVYILTNKKNGVLYIGVTSNLLKRVQEHKEKIVKGFTWKYNIVKLVYYECTDTAYGAISREKVLKKWNRAWKIRLIEKENKNWEDLFDTMQM